MTEAGKWLHGYEDIFRKCIYVYMRTNIEIDDALINKAQKLTNIKTKKAVVEKALQTLVRLENQKKLLDFWGTVEFDPNLFP